MSTFCGRVLVAAVLLAASSGAAVNVKVVQPLIIGPNEQRGKTTLLVSVPTAEKASVNGNSGAEPASEGSGADPEIIDLRAGPLVHKASMELLPGQLEFKQRAFTLQAGEAKEVEVEVSDVTFDGEAEVKLLNRGEELSTLTVTRPRLAVTLESATPFRPGHPVALKLRNDSRYPVRARWKLTIDAYSYCGDEKEATGGSASDPDSISHRGSNGTRDGTATESEPTTKTVGIMTDAHAEPATVNALNFENDAPRHGEPCGDVAGWPIVEIPAKGAEVITFVVPEGSPWFSESWLLPISEVAKSAALWIDVGGSGSTASSSTLPRRELPFDALLQGPWYPGQNIWILLFLGFGAGFSLLVRHWVPNLQRKRELKERARQLCAKVKDFSSLVPSQLREQARAQAELVVVSLRSTLTLLPDYATVASQCAQTITLLEKRVDLIAEIDSVRSKLGYYWDKTPPPTQVDAIEAYLDAAATELQKLQPVEADILAVRAALDGAKSIVAEMSSPDSPFASALSERVQAMEHEGRALEKLAGEFGVQKEVVALQEAIKQLATLPAGSSPGTLPAEKQGPLDYSLRALSVWRDYLWVARGTSSADVAALESVRQRLLTLLPRHSWNELYAAEVELRQYRERVTPEDVLSEVSKEGSVYITHEPHDITYPQVVNFRVRFHRDELNWSAARAAVSPEWRFESNGGLPVSARETNGPREARLPLVSERGEWQVSHLFLDPRSRLHKLRELIAVPWIAPRCERVCVRFTSLGPSAAQGSIRPLEISIPVRRARLSENLSRTAGEVLSLAVVLTIPLVSLVAGAKEQLSPDPSAAAAFVFLLGFGSDAIMSVFRQRAGVNG